MTRLERVFAILDHKGIGLEIGPSHSPFAPKKKGYHVHIVDHASKQDLIRKYQGHQVNLDNIEDVDFIWSGQKLSDLVGKKKHYDWIIASHVIEHTTDLVTFLQECSALLKDTGVLSLVIPDKRYCFDYFRWPSSTGDVLQAYLEERTIHSPGVVADHFLNAVKSGGEIAWSKFTQGKKEFVHSPQVAKDSFVQAQKSSDYIDVHNWRFTPSSFRLLLHDLLSFGYVDLGEVISYDTVGSEFYFSLGKSSSQKVRVYNRSRLTQAMMQEVKYDRASVFNPLVYILRLTRMSVLRKLAKLLLGRK
ncbi:MAG: class I SAM-dependent methyltransferase [Turneriella sp.]|nr:class I SAM-dependent methyltransferase [Turneriella sp.]